MRPIVAFAFAAVASLAAAASIALLLYPRRYKPAVNGITDLVAFGDSYSDESRFIYFLSSKGALPPPRYVPPSSNDTATGGHVWPRLLANATGIKLHDYAVAGSVCSNLLTPRSCVNCFQPDGPIPSMQEYAVPAFLGDYRVSNGLNDYEPSLDSKHTVFSIWIGTNDLGYGNLLTDQQIPGAGLGNVTDCALNAITTLYEAGARKFVFQSVPPLWLAPMYASDARGGVGDFNHYWIEKSTFLGGNKTAISLKMRELIESANQIYASRIPLLAASLEGSEITYLDNYSIILDIIQRPEQYLTPPYNTTGFEHQCGSTCQDSYLMDPAHPDGYVWYDEIHPTQRTSSVIASEFAKALSRQSAFATYYP